MMRSPRTGCIKLSWNGGTAEFVGRCDRLGMGRRPPREHVFVLSRRSRVSLFALRRAGSSGQRCSVDGERRGFKNSGQHKPGLFQKLVMPITDASVIGITSF